MSVSTPSRIEQREQLVEKVEQAVTHKAQLGNQGLILHFRIVLRDLPFGGLPSLLLDDHKQAINKLVERSKSHDIKIFSITGHTSEPGSNEFNNNLAQQRAEAVAAQLEDATVTAGLPDNSLYAGIKVHSFGETQPLSPTIDGSDNPLNRRVEIAYRIKIIFPQPPGGIAVARSRYWRIDFSANGNSEPEQFSVGVVDAEAGQGSLTMLPDEDNQTALTHPLTYMSLGVSVGLLSTLKKLKFTKRFPKIKRLFKDYQSTVDFLENAGIPVDFDLLDQGGEFITDEPLSFAEMSRFNFSMIAGNISLGGSASGSLVMLHSGNFFASTVIYNAEINIADPDLGLNFIPAAVVQVNL